MKRVNVRGGSDDCRVSLWGEHKKGDGEASVFASASREGKVEIESKGPLVVGKGESVELDFRGVKIKASHEG